MTAQLQNLQDTAASRTVTLLMLLCGLVLSGVAAAADAPVPERALPTRTVHFSRSSLATDEGARSVYRSIVSAANTVCPLQSGSPFVTDAIKACRAQAVARAVHDIGSTRLAAVHAISGNQG